MVRYTKSRHGAKPRVYVPVSGWHTRPLLKGDSANSLSAHYPKLIGAVQLTCFSGSAGVHSLLLKDTTSSLPAHCASNAVLQLPLCRRGRAYAEGPTSAFFAGPLRGIRSVISPETTMQKYKLFPNWQNLFSNI